MQGKYGIAVSGIVVSCQLSESGFIGFKDFQDYRRYRIDGRKSLCPDC